MAEQLLPDGPHLTQGGRYFRAEYDRGVYRTRIPVDALAVSFRAKSLDGRTVEIRCERFFSADTVEALYRPMLRGKSGWTLEPVAPHAVPAIQERMAGVEFPLLPCST